MAAVFIAGVFLLANHLFGEQDIPPLPKPPIAKDVEPVDDNRTEQIDPQKQPSPAPTGLELAKGLFEQGNVEGLLTLLETGRDETRIAAADYLGQIGDERAIPVLQKFAEQWNGPKMENPFQMAIDQIEQRLKNDESATDPNQQAAQVIDTPEGTFSEQEAETIITGVVIDAESLSPISGAKVYSRTSEVEIVTTDAQGRFTIYLAEFQDRSVYVNALASGYTSRQSVVRLRKGQTQRLIFKLGPESKVVGVVKDSLDQPIKGATVSVINVFVKSVTTDTEGGFSFAGLDPKVTQYEIRVRHPDYTETPVGFSPAPAGQIRHLNVCLKQGKTLFGQVTDPQGLPISGVKVGRRHRNGAKNKTTTDPNGMYRLEHVPEDAWILWAAHVDYALFVQPLTVSGEPFEQRVDIQLDEPYPLYGRVTDQTGSPVPGVNVTVNDLEGARDLWKEVYETNKQGEFTIPNTPNKGEICILVQGEGILNKHHTFNLGEQECVISVAKAQTQTERIYGKVVDDLTNDPISSFTIKLGYDRGVGEKIQIRTDEGLPLLSSQGFFEIGAQRLGSEYYVTASAEGYDPLTLGPIQAQASLDDPNRTLFRLKPASVASGRVVDEQGRPIPGVMVSVVSGVNMSNQPDEQRLMADENGIFTLSGMTPEKQCICVTVPGYVPYVGLVIDLLNDQNQLEDIVLERGARIFGHVFNADGEPIENGSVTIWNNGYSKHRFMRQALGYPVPDLDPRVKTDRNGYYELLGVPVGWICVDVRSGRKLVHSHVDESIELNFGDESGFRVEGMVRRGSKPITNATVELNQKNWEYNKTARTDNSGMFKIVGLASGQYHLWVRPQAQGANTTNDWLGYGFDIVRDLDLDIDVQEKSVLETGRGIITGWIPDTLRADADMLKVWAARQVDIDPVQGDTERSWECVLAESIVQPNGSFACRRLASGTYRLFVSRKGKTVALSNHIVLPEAAEVSGIHFAAGTGDVSIQAVDSETGQGIPDALLTLTNEVTMCLGYPRQGKKVDDQGRYSVSDFASGRYQVQASAQGYLFAVSPWVDVLRGQVTPITITLTPAARIRFELSPSLYQEFTSDRSNNPFGYVDKPNNDKITIKCRVTDITTHNVVQRQTFSGTSDYYYAYINTAGPENSVSSTIDLPEGSYTIDYTMYLGNVTDTAPLEAFKRAVRKIEITCLQNQTTSVMISE